MTPTDSFGTYWWFHIPNLIMAALFYTLIGRYALELMFGNKTPVIVTVFRTVTNPITKLVRAITPRVIPDGIIIVFTMAWLLAARMFWFLTAVAAGMRLTAGA